MDSFDLDAFLPYQLAVLASRVSREFAALYGARFDLSIAEWRVVAHLGQEEAVSVREIHERVDMDKSKVSRAASRLEAAGYVTKRISESDRRLVELTLTATGRAMHSEIVELARGFEAALEERLGPEAAKFRTALSGLLEGATKA